MYNGQFVTVELIIGLSMQVYFEPLALYVMFLMTEPLSGVNCVKLMVSHKLLWRADQMLASITFHGLIPDRAILLGASSFYGCQSYTLRANQSVGSKKRKFLFFGHFNFKEREKKQQLQA